MRERVDHAIDRDDPDHRAGDAREAHPCKIVAFSSDVVARSGVAHAPTTRPHETRRVTIA